MFCFNDFNKIMVGTVLNIFVKNTYNITVKRQKVSVQNQTRIGSVTLKVCLKSTRTTQTIHFAKFDNKKIKKCWT